MGADCVNAAAGSQQMCFDGSASTTDLDLCSVSSSTYTHTATETIVSSDPNTGAVCLSNIDYFEGSTLRSIVVVGSETFTSPQFNYRNYDCRNTLFAA